MLILGEGQFGSILQHLICPPPVRHPEGLHLWKAVSGVHHAQGADSPVLLPELGLTLSHLGQAEAPLLQYMCARLAENMVVVDPRSVSKALRTGPVGGAMLRRVILPPPLSAPRLAMAFMCVRFPLL